MSSSKYKIKSPADGSILGEVGYFEEKDIPIKDAPHPFSEKAVSFYQTYHNIIILFFLIVLGSSIYLATKNVVNANPYDYFSEDVPLKKANDFVLERLGGTGGPELVIESGSPEGVKSPEFLKKVEALQEWIDGNPRVNKTVSIINILKSMNRSLHGDNQEYYKKYWNKIVFDRRDT